MSGPVDRRSDALDERTLHAVAVRECAAQRRGHADGSGPQVRTRRRPRHWRDRHARHRGRRRRRRAATDLRQYAVLLPGDHQRNRKFSTAVAAKFPFRSGAGGSVPPERTGDGRRPSRVRQRGEPLGCRRRLARPAARRWHRDRRGQQRDRRQRLFDAAFAANSTTASFGC